MLIRSISIADSGAYSCIAENLAGSIQSAVANVIVFAKPEIDSLPVKLSLPDPPFGVINTNCFATGSPTPKLYWTFNGNQITEKTLAKSKLRNGF